MENCTQVLDDSFFDNTPSPAPGRSKVGTLLINETPYDIFTGENVIGRDELSDIVLRSGMISSKHAVVEVEDWESHFLYDCGSTNKTRLNKAVLKPNVKYFLKGEEEIWFANFKAKYIKCEKPQTVVAPDDDSGSETGSESMLNCDSIDLGVEEETSLQRPNENATKNKPEEIVDESRKSITDSITSLNSSTSFVQEKMDSSSNQVVDGSIDDSTDDEDDFFILPSQTVKEFNQKRFEQNKVSKVAEQICTEDIFDSTENNSHSPTKSVAPSVDCSKEDIFEAETQELSVNIHHKQTLGKAEDPDYFDSQSVFNTECMEVKTTSSGDKCDPSIFETETQPLSVDSPLKGFSKAVLKDVEEENIFEVETQINDVAQTNLEERDKINKEENIVEAETEINNPAPTNLKEKDERKEEENMFEAETQINDLILADIKEKVQIKSEESIFEAETQVNYQTKIDLPNNMENIHEVQIKDSRLADEKEMEKLCNTESIFEAVTQVNTKLAANETTSICKMENIFEVATQVNKLGSNATKETTHNCETENIFDAETQANELVQQGSSKDKIKTNVEDNIFEAATQINNLGSDATKETTHNCETENIFDAETQANELVQQGSLKDKIKTNVEDNIFEAATQVNDKALKLYSKSTVNSNEKETLLEENVKETLCERFQTDTETTKTLLSEEEIQSNNKENGLKNDDLEMSELVLSSDFTEVLQSEMSNQQTQPSTNLLQDNIKDSSIDNTNNLVLEAKSKHSPPDSQYKVKNEYVEDEKDKSLENITEGGTQINVDDVCDKNILDRESDEEDALTQVNNKRLKEGESKNKIKNSEVRVEDNFDDALTQVNTSLKLTSKPPEEYLKNRSNLNAQSKTLSDFENGGDEALTQINPKLKDEGFTCSKREDRNDKLSLKQTKGRNNTHCKHSQVDSTSKTQTVSSPPLKNVEINNTHCILSNSQIAFCEQPTELNLNILFKEDESLDDMQTQPVEKCESPISHNIEAEETQLNIKVHKKSLIKRKAMEPELQKATTENKEQEENSDDTDIESETTANENQSPDRKDQVLVSENKINTHENSKNFGFDESSTESDSILASVPLDIDEINEKEIENQRNDKYEDNNKIKEDPASEELSRASQEGVGMKSYGQEETIAKSTIKVADMDICSTVGNVYVSSCESSKKYSPKTHSNSTLSASEIKTSVLKKSFQRLQNKIVPIEEQDREQKFKPSKVKKLFNSEDNALNDTLNQSIHFNQPCSSSTPFKVESNAGFLKSDQKTGHKEMLLKTPPRETKVMKNPKPTPLLPSTQELLAVADKSPETILKPEKQRFLSLALKKTPRVKKPSRKVVESLEFECDARTSAQNVKNKKPESNVSKVKKSNKKENPDKEFETFPLPTSESCEEHQYEATKDDNVEIGPQANSPKTSLIKEQSNTQQESKTCVILTNYEIMEEEISLQKKVDSNSTRKSPTVENNCNDALSENTTSRLKKTKKSNSKNVVPCSINKKEMEVTLKSSKKSNSNTDNLNTSSPVKNKLQSRLKNTSAEKELLDINSTKDSKIKSNNVLVESQSLRPTRASKRNHVKENITRDQKIHPTIISLNTQDNLDSEEIESSNTKDESKGVQEPSKKSRRIAGKEMNTDTQNKITATKEVSLDLHKVGHSEEELVITKDKEEPRTKAVEDEKKTRNKNKSKKSNPVAGVENECRLLESDPQDVRPKSKRKIKDGIDVIPEAKRSKLSKNKKNELIQEKSVKDEECISKTSSDRETQSEQRKPKSSRLGKSEVNFEGSEKPDESVDKIIELTNKKEQLQRRSKKTLKVDSREDCIEEISESSKDTTVRQKHRGKKTDGDKTDKEHISNNILGETPAATKGKRKLADCTEHLTPTKHSRSSRNKTISQKQEENVEDDSVNSQTSSKRTRAKPARFRDEESLLSDSGSEKIVKRSGRSILSNSTESVDSSVSESERIKKSIKNTKFAKPAKNSSQKKTKELDNTVNVVDRSRTNIQVSIEGKGTRSRSGSQSSRSSAKSDTFSTSSMSSPRRSVKRRENVLFTGLTNPVLEANIKKLGGCVVDCPTDCSVLVTDKVRRTVKFLCVLAQGKPIVTPEWVTHSWKCCRFEDPTDHLLLDFESQQKFDFKLSETMNAAKKQPLLSGYTVHATPRVKPPPEDIQSIVECCGGTYLKKVPSKWPEQSFVISTAEDKSLWKKIKVKNITPPIVATEMLLSGILQHKIDFQTHKIL